MKMVKRKKLRVVGAVFRNDTGRSEIAYGRRCKQDNVEHEVWVAEVEVILKVRIERGARVGKTEADGVFEREENKCWLEIDNKTMWGKQMKAKWRRYEGCEGFILVVAHDETRMEWLRRGAELVKDLALFTTFERLRCGKPCVDFSGNTIELR